MRAASAVVLLGIICGALGLAVPTMYDVAVVVLVIGLTGVGIRLIEWAVWLRT